VNVEEVRLSVGCGPSGSPIKAHRIDVAAQGSSAIQGCSVIFGSSGDFLDGRYQNFVVF
jgi:hypothetical protein